MPCRWVKVIHKIIHAHRHACVHMTSHTVDLFANCIEGKVLFKHTPFRFVCASLQLSQTHIPIQTQCTRRQAYGLVKYCTSLQGSKCCGYKKLRLCHSLKHLTSTIVWDKHHCALLILCEPRPINATQLSHMVQS